MEGDAAVKTAELGGARAWFVWALAVAFVVLYFSFQTGYAIVNPSVQKDIGLSLAQTALVAAVYTWIFALFQFLSGALLDRLGAGKIIPASIALVTIGIFLFANAQSYGMLLLSQLIIAVGACSGFVGAGYIGGQWFGMAQFSFMFGLVQFATAFFSAFNQNLLSLALTTFTWRELFNFMGFSGIALFILGALFIKNPTPIVRPAESFTNFLSAVVKGIGEVAKIPHIWIASAFGALCFGVMLGLRDRLGAQIVGRARVRRRNGKLVGLIVVARLGGRLLCDSQMVRSDQTTQVANHYRHRRADRGTGAAALSTRAQCVCGDGLVLRIRVWECGPHACFQHRGRRGEAQPDRHVRGNRERRHVPCRRDHDQQAGCAHRLGD